MPGMLRRGDRVLVRTSYGTQPGRVIEPQVEGKVLVAVTHPGLPSKLLLPESSVRRPMDGAADERQVMPERFTLAEAAEVSEVVEKPPEYPQQEWLQVGLKRKGEKWY